LTKPPDAVGAAARGCPGRARWADGLGPVGRHAPGTIAKETCHGGAAPPSAPDHARHPTDASQTRPRTLGTPQVFCSIFAGRCQVGHTHPWYALRVRGTPHRSCADRDVGRGACSRAERDRDLEATGAGSTGAWPPRRRRGRGVRRGHTPGPGRSTTSAGVLRIGHARRSL
jgi:hypothetical protein